MHQDNHSAFDLCRSGLADGPSGVYKWALTLQELQVNHDAGVYYKVNEKATPVTNP